MDTIEPPTKVIFRMIGKPAECLALFPRAGKLREPWTCLNYAADGKHGHGMARSIGRPAKPEEYADLKQHLETYLGENSYRLDVVQRFTPSHTEARKTALARDYTPREED